jgi:hypothetical protein
VLIILLLVVEELVEFFQVVTAVVVEDLVDLEQVQYQ